MTITLDIYWPWLILQTWFGMIPPRGPGIQRVPRAFIMPMSMPMLPQWANDDHVAHPQAKRVPMNLFRSQSAWWLLIYGVSNVPRSLIMPVGMPMWPQWQMTMILNIWPGQMGEWMDEQTDKKTDGQFHTPLFPQKGWGKTHFTVCLNDQIDWVSVAITQLLDCFHFTLPTHGNSLYWIELRVKGLNSRSYLFETAGYI